MCDKRSAGGIVDGDVPALQFGGDAARQRAVGRDQRGGSVLGVFQRFAQGERDDRGFLGRIGGLDQRQAFEPCGDRLAAAFGERAPGIGRRRGPQRLAQQQFARVRGVGVGPVAHVVRV